MRQCLFALLVVACSSPSKSTTTPQPKSELAANVEPPPEPVERAPEPVAAPVAKQPMSLAQSGIVADWMDKAADPCQDFFAYACGGFTKTAVIPADRSSWGAIQIVTKDNEEFLKKVLEDAAAKPSGDPVLDKIGAYYAACMDESAIEKAGLAPIQPLLDAIAAKDPAHATIALQADGLNPFFGIGPVQDFGDATKVIAGIDQSGLGLPDKKYYLENAGSMKKTRGVYLAHIERMFALSGMPAAAAKTAAADTMRIETQLAKWQQDEVERRDPHKIYHRVERAGLEKTAGQFPWGDLLTALDIGSVTQITVNDPAYYTHVAKLVATEKPAALKSYLTWTVLRGGASELSNAWVEEAFTMQKELKGVKEIAPRWRRCVNRVDSDLGELLGQSYVKARFGGDAKTRAVDLTKAVLGAMRAELDSLAWMDDGTRGAAKAKLDKMAYLVGFPDKWRKYEFEVSRTDKGKNLRAATRWELARQLKKIGQPVDRLDWGMTPPTVNAYYDPSLNEIALPAGQLQPPFFGPTFHPAVNFGSTGGGTIGHEMTHGFDDEGSQFDGDGNLKDWWSKGTKAKFGDATKCVQDQYSKYEAIPKVHLDGKLTSGENIADIGGVKLAFQAYQTWKTSQPQPVQSKIEDLTDDQLYFLAYGQSWCEKVTDAQLETMAHSNPHSPPKWRVNGVIVNQPGFGSAFKCAAGTPMNPGKACSVW